MSSDACAYDTPRSLISRTASSLNSRVNCRLSMTHLLLHKTPNSVSSEPGAAQDDFLSYEGWSHFSLGNVLEAQRIARALVDHRADPNDRELDINTAIESGDWG